MLFRNTTWTMSRDTQQGLAFTGVNYYDGQGFMTRKELNVTSATELDGATVCVQTGTTTELNLADYFSAQGMTFTPVVFEELAEVNAAYDSGGLRCLHHGRLGPRRDPPDAERAGRPHPAARDHLQGAARTGGAAGRRPVVHDRDAGCTSLSSPRRSRA